MGKLTYYIPLEEIYSQLSKEKNRNLQYILKNDFLEKEEFDNKKIKSLEKNIYKENYILPIELYTRNIIEKNQYYSLNCIKKNIKEIYNTSYKNYIPNFNISPNYIGVQAPETGMITADNIASFALPIVAYIHTMQPDFIIACDRGARPLGLAIAALYRRIHGRLPTTDGTLRFRRISKSNSEEETEAHLAPLFEEMKQARDKAKVLVLDDWVSSGGTKQLVERIAERQVPRGIELHWGVLCGGNADVSGDQARYGGCVDWHDNVKIIGVDYVGTKAHVLRSEQAGKWRQRMHQSIENLLEKKEEESTPRPVAPTKGYALAI